MPGSLPAMGYFRPMVMRRAAGLAPLHRHRSEMLIKDLRVLTRPLCADALFPLWSSATPEALVHHPQVPSSQAAALPAPPGLARLCSPLVSTRCSGSMGSVPLSSCWLPQRGDIRRHCDERLSSWIDPHPNPLPIFGEFPTEPSPPSPVETRSTEYSLRPPYH